MLNLAKNPAGFNQNISAVMTDQTPKDIIILINDNSQDGTDVSWLWDVDFDRLKDTHAASITVCGIRFPGHAASFEICGHSLRGRIGH